MNVWKLVSANRLNREEAEIPEPKEGELKIRVTKVLVNCMDASIYNGDLKVTYPLIPGRFAVGMIAGEDGPVGLEHGTRVLLHTFRPAPDTGTAKKDFTEEDYEIAGQTANGYLRDFVCLPEDEVSAIPDSVCDDAALLIELVALAKATLDALDVRKGQHVAVIGGDMLGVILCQLLIYQQASPILIDNHTNRLEFAKQCGVYYTLFADDNLIENVARLTGGRFAESAIYVTSSGTQDKSLPFKVCAPHTAAAYSGFHGRDLTVNLDLALKKQITIYGMTNGADYIPAAINLLANKAIDVSRFERRAFKADDCEATFGEMGKNPADRDIRVLNIAELI